MRDGRILATKVGHFDLAPWDGVNRSGLEPVCDKVLVRVDRALERVGSIIVPDHERQTLSSTTGVLIAIGPQAFLWNSTRTAKWEGGRPEVGTRIAFTRYAGQEYTGLDGLMYRVLDDVLIGATMGSALGGEDESLTGASMVSGGSVVMGSTG